MATQRTAKQLFTALQQTHKHKADNKLLYIVKGVCLRKRTHSDKHTHIHRAGCESAVLGEWVTKSSFLGFCPARAEDAHMRVLRRFYTASTQRGHTQRSPEVGLRTAWAWTNTKWGRKGREVRGFEVILRQAPLWIHKGWQWWYLRGPCGRALPVSRSISCSCLRLIGAPVLLMHAATANPLWALASCRGLSTAEDVNNRAGDKKENKTERYNDRVEARESLRNGTRKETRGGMRVNDYNTKGERKEKQSRRSVCEGASMHYTLLL